MQKGKHRSGRLGRSLLGCDPCQGSHPSSDRVCFPSKIELNLSPSRASALYLEPIAKDCMGPVILAAHTYSLSFCAVIYLFVLYRFVFKPVAEVFTAPDRIPPASSDWMY